MSRPQLTHDFRYTQLPICYESGDQVLLIKRKGERATME